MMTIVMPPVAPVAPEADLGARIRAAHDAVRRSLGDAVRHATEAGQLLLEAKAAVGHGGWLPWLRENCGLSERTAQVYMRLARELPGPDRGDPQRAADMSLREALALLAEPRDGRQPHAAWTGEVEWYTPAPYVEAARTVMGGIDLDPASSRLAQETVRASVFYTAETDGLGRPRRGRVWLNPPYRADLIGRFVRKLLDELEAGDVPEAVLLVHARTDARWFHHAALSAAALCLTLGRIRFEAPEGPADSPTTGSAFFYFGTRPDTFAATFGAYGIVFLDRAPPVRAAAAFDAETTLYDALPPAALPPPESLAGAPKTPWWLPEPEVTP